MDKVKVEQIRTDAAEKQKRRVAAEEYRRSIGSKEVAELQAHPVEQRQQFPAPAPRPSP